MLFHGSLILSFVVIMTTMGMMATIDMVALEEDLALYIQQYQVRCGHSCTECLPMLLVHTARAQVSRKCPI